MSAPFNGDGALSSLEMPEHEALFVADDSFAGAHPSCVVCGETCCDDQVTCGCGPPPIALDTLALEVACSPACQAKAGS